MDPQDHELDKVLQERFATLPKVVQDAITSADVEQHLRELANTHKLHLDQWETLEDQVMLTLLGLQDSDNLAHQIEVEVGIPKETAMTLANDISQVVFEPIRQELERQLDNPDAKEKSLTGVETMREQALAQEKASTVAPATPPQDVQADKVVRTQVSETYKTGETSVSRKDVHNDPYREPPV